MSAYPAQQPLHADAPGDDPGLAGPYPLADTLGLDAAGRALDRDGGTIRIDGAQLLANDLALASRTPLAIAAVGDAVGGRVELADDGAVLFTPAPGFDGLMRFHYRLAGSDARAAVTLRSADLPAEPLLDQAWHLQDAAVLPVWRDYTGKGVRIGQFEAGDSGGPGLPDLRHPELLPAVDPAGASAATATGALSEHATGVAGVMVAANDGKGSLGVAFDARLHGYSLGAEPGNLDTLGSMADVDIANHSWSFQVPFDSTFRGTVDALYRSAAATGRGGLGTVIVCAAGNQRASGGSAQGSPSNNNRYAIQVAGLPAPTDQDTAVLTERFSNPGASLLVSAPSSRIVSTAPLAAADGQAPADTHGLFHGTSFAAPIVSGVAALMLEANPSLGYRDVQQILAYSARRVDDPGTVWQVNGAGNWNGGGLHVSHDYGFGRVDARAAVRLAESWTTQQTEADLVRRDAHSGAPGLTVAGGDSRETALRLEDGLRIEHVEVDIDAGFGRLGDLGVTLVAPDGTESVLLDRPGKAPGSSAADRGDDRSEPLRYTLTSTRHWGERSGGEWRLRLTSADGGAPVTLNRWSLRTVGAPETAGEAQIYTDEFATAGGDRLTVADGTHTLNAAAVHAGSTIDLRQGSATIAGRALTLRTPERIRRLVGGDGDDHLTAGNAGHQLEGGRGRNRLEGGAGSDLFVVRRHGPSFDTIVGFEAAGGDRIALVGFAGKRFEDLCLSQQGDDVLVALSATQGVLLKNQSLAAIGAGQFNFVERPQPAPGLLARQSLRPAASEPPRVVYLDGAVTGFTLNRQGIHFTGTTYQGDSTPNRFVVRQHGRGNFSNTLLGFKDGVDRIDVSALGITDRAELGVARVNMNNLRGCNVFNKGIQDWRKPRNLVFLPGVDAGRIDGDDFIFAGRPAAATEAQSARLASQRLVQAMAAFAPATAAPLDSASEARLSTPVVLAPSPELSR